MMGLPSLPAARAAVATVVFLAAVGGCEGHGWMTFPPSRNGGNLDDDIDKCLDSGSFINGTYVVNVTADCMWFTSSTTIPVKENQCVAP